MHVYYNPPKDPSSPEEVEATTKQLGNVICRDVSKAYQLFCTRKISHAGDHIAGSAGKVLERWPNEEG